MELKPHRPADPLDTRIRAFLVDAFLYILYSLGVGLCMAVLMPPFEKILGGAFVVCVNLGLVVVLPLLYYFRVCWSGSGTRGMVANGICVRAEDGSRLSAGASLVRTLMLPISIVAFVVPVVRKDRRALHDLLSASTVVYRTDLEDCFKLCKTCGYNPTGNTSGRCPECGSLIRQGK